MSVDSQNVARNSSCRKFWGPPSISTIYVVLFCFFQFEHHAGEEYIKQCSTLKIFKYQYLFENFGFTNCTLSDIFDAFGQKKMCEDKLETKIKFLMGFGATS